MCVSRRNHVLFFLSPGSGRTQGLEPGARPPGHKPFIIEFDTTVRRALSAPKQAVGPAWRRGWLGLELDLTRSGRAGKFHQVAPAPRLKSQGLVRA
jgi:hypothetical protein